MPKVLFVCTGNTCRSPMAEKLFQKYKKEFGLSDWQALSAGLNVIPGSRGSDKMLQVMAEKDIKVNGHQAQSISPGLVEQADLVLTMTEYHKDVLCQRFSRGKEKIYTLQGFIGHGELNITDPMGRSADVYRQTRDMIEKAIKRLLGELKTGDIYFAQKELKIMKIIIGSDHAGYELKEIIIDFFQENEIDYQDIGTDSVESVDYPDYAGEVAHKVAENDQLEGILICGTGIGMSIAANKVEGVRAAHCHDTVSARAARQHNDANVLTMGARIIGPDLAREIVRVWLEESFNGGRHQRRVNKIGDLE
ncbi:MAG: ribose 5-phosphate isomerase B [Bacillota bacterium]